MKDVFGCAEEQEKVSYGLGYKSKIQRDSDNHVLSHPAGANVVANLALAGKIFIEDIKWYVPHNTPIISDQK